MDFPPGVHEPKDSAGRPLYPSKRDTPAMVSPPLAVLLDKIEALILQYVALPDQTLAMLIALWVSNTYVFDRFQYCGYLVLRSATPRCGKTRLLRLIALLASDSPKVTIIPTAAVLFRSQRRVLILDEVDRLRNADKEKFGDVLAVLQSGFERGGTVERLERRGNTFSPQTFSVFGPVALAGIEAVADTLVDRAFLVQMQRTPTRKPRLHERHLDAVAQQIRGSLTAWADAHGSDLEGIYEKLPDELTDLVGLDDRMQDIAEPLVVIASVADAERPEGPKVLPRLLEGLKAVAGRREISGRERDLLAFLEIIGPHLDGVEKIFIPSAELVTLCREREELSWIETPRALAGFLKHFDLRPETNKEKTLRGYLIQREWGETWRLRYR